MGQNGLDQEQLYFEIDPRDWPVFVSADVEDQRAAGRRVIRGLERLFDCRKMRPKSSSGDGHKPLQRLTGGGVFFRESRDDCLTENLHDPRFPFASRLAGTNPPSCRDQSVLQSCRTQMSRTDPIERKWSMCSSVLGSGLPFRETRRNATFSNPNASVKENKNRYSSCDAQ